jgi:hypothetical protein
MHGKAALTVVGLRLHPALPKRSVGRRYGWAAQELVLPESGKTDQTNPAQAQLQLPGNRSIEAPGAEQHHQQIMDS